MSNLEKGLFDKLQQSANVNPDDIYKTAEAVKNANFNDEQTVRQLVQHLSRIANKRISKEKEDKIVASIISNQIPMDLQSLNQYFEK